jgi:hypothetical protein
MSLKKTLLLISTFSSLTFFSTKSFASNDPQLINQDIDEKKEIEKQKNNLTVDQIFTQGGNDYTLYKDLKAYVGEPKQINNEPLNNRSKSKSLKNGKNILLDKGIFKIYEDNDYSFKPSQTEKSYVLGNNQYSINESKNYGYNVAYNNQTKKFGLITDNIIIKVDPTNNINLPPNDDDFSYKVVREYKGMGISVIRLSRNTNYQNAINKLKNLNPDREIQKSIVIVEVLENFKSPN